MGWERVWGPTALVAIDGEGGHVYATSTAQSSLEAIYQWTGEPDCWKSIGTWSKPVKKLVCAGCKPKSFLCCLTSDGAVHRYVTASGAWESLGGPDHNLAGNIYGGPDQLLASGTGAAAGIARWDEATHNWVAIGGPGKNFVIGRSSDIDFRFQVYGQSPDDAPADVKGVYQWTGGWYKRGGPAGSILVSGSMLFATDPGSGDMMWLSPDGWKHIGGPGAMFAADHCGHLYGLATDRQSVWAWDGTPNHWHKIGGPAGQIFAGWDRQVFATNPQTGELFHYLGDSHVTVSVPDFAGKLFTTKMPPVTGKRQLAVVLWDPKRPAHPAPARSALESALFGPRPSVRDWFHENSGGRMELVNAGVLGWYEAPSEKQEDHYWDNPDPQSTDPARRDALYHQNKYHDGWLEGHSEKWANAILRAAQDFAFDGFNTKKDGVLAREELGVLVVIPQNESYGTMRPTSGGQYPKTQPLVVQGCQVPVITEWYSGAPPDVATAAHELAHLLLNTGDMYFDGFWPYAADSYSNSDCCRIVHLSAPEKLKLGWLNYSVALQPGKYTLHDVETTGEALVLFNPGRGPDEYFVIENRWRGTSYDAGGPAIGAGLPMDGVAIWHVIENPAVFNSVNPFPPTGAKDDWSRLGIRLIRANGGDPFDDHQALFAAKGACISGYGAPATLRWLSGAPSGFRVKMLTAPAPAVELEIMLSNP